MIALAGLLIALGIAWGFAHFSSVQKSFQIKPRIAFAQVVVAGQTEQSEQMQMTATLFVDESKEAWDSKLEILYKLREERLEYQNNRMLELQKESIKRGEEAKAEAERLGIPLNVTPFNQSKG